MANTSSSRRRRRWLLFGAAVLLGLPLLVAGAALWYFDGEWLKAKLQQAAREELGRKLEIGRVEFSLFAGRVGLEEIALRNADGDFAERDTLRIAEAQIEAPIFALFWNGPVHLEGVRVRLERPEILLERRREGERWVTNLDDQYARFFSGPPSTWPLETGLRALEARVEIAQGRVVLRDEAHPGPPAEFRALDLTTASSALGAPLEFSLSAAMPQPDREQGTLRLAGHAVVLDAEGRFDPSGFRDLKVDADLAQVDVARFAAFFGVEGTLREGELRWTLGEPVSGKLALTGPALDQIKLSTELTTPGIVALWRGALLAANDLPGRMQLEADANLLPGAFALRRLAGELTAGSLTGRPDAPLSLLFATGAPQDGARAITALFACDLKDLLATEVGKTLGLHGVFEGKLKGNANFAFAEMETRFNLGLDAGQATVLVRGARQPLELDVTAMGTLTQSDRGIVEAAEFSFVAKSAAFTLASREPVKLGMLADSAGPSVSAALQTSFDGPVIWERFQPLLKAFNFGTPLRESWDGALAFTCDGTKAELNLDGVYRHPIEGAVPLRAVLKGRYYHSAIERGEKAQSEWGSLQEAMVVATVREPSAVSSGVQHERVRLILTGGLAAGPGGVSGRQLSLQVQRQPPQGQAFEESVAFDLDAFAREPGQTWWEAAAAPGAPLHVKISVRTKENIRVATLLETGEIFRRLAPTGKDPNAKPAEQAFAKLRLETNLRVPNITLDTLRLREVDIPTLELVDLRTHLGKATAKIDDAGRDIGDLTVQMGVYDLTGDPLEHSQRFSLANVDLHRVTSDPRRPASDDEYRLYGRLGGTGSLNGRGFDRAGLRTFNGSFDAHVEGFVAERKGGKKENDIGSVLKRMGLDIGGAVLGGSTGRMLQLYGDDFGVFRNRLEFEPFKVAMKIEKGVLRISEGRLHGVNENAGLTLGYAGGIDLPTETFAPEFHVWPVALPATTQEKLGLHKLSVESRVEKLERFARGEFKLRLTGSIHHPKRNDAELTAKFGALLDEIERELGGSPAEQQAEPAAEPDKQTLPKKPSDILDILKELGE